MSRSQKYLTKARNLRVKKTLTGEQEGPSNDKDLDIWSASLDLAIDTSSPVSIVHETASTAPTDDVSFTKPIDIEIDIENLDNPEVTLAASMSPPIVDANDISPSTKLYLDSLFNGMIAKFNAELRERDLRIDGLEKRNADLEMRCERSKYEIKAAKIELDNLQQYQRRRNVRIEGIETIEGETEDKLFKSIQKTLKEVDVEVEEKDIIRFHRSAAPKINKETKKMCQQVIVQFSHWKPRKQCHFANRKARDAGKSFRIHHDLTSKRYNMLNDVRAEISRRFGKQPTGEGAPPQVFVYADMNCNLLIRRGEESFRFEDKKDVDPILNQLARYF